MTTTPRRLDYVVTAMNGVRIIESMYLTEAGESYEKRRTWRDRLFSRPWRPLKATRTVIPQVPMKGGYQLANGTMVMHPETVAAMRRLVTRDSQNP